MKKIILSSVLSFCAIGAAFAATAPWSWDFTQGGEGFTCYDQDAAVPSATAQKYGFSAEGDSWIFSTIDKEFVAISNSSHKAATATAEDWLITPAITLTEDNVLSFDAYTVAYSNTKRVAKLDVKLSTSGVAIEDFTESLMDGEAVENSNYGVDLSEYVGKTDHIAL